MNSLVFSHFFPVTRSFHEMAIDLSGSSTCWNVMDVKLFHELNLGWELCRLSLIELGCDIVTLRHRVATSTWVDI